MRRTVVSLLALGAIVAQAGLPANAQAACYEGVGCTDSNRYSWTQLRDIASCQVLWEMRNGIFHENGYCFQSDRAINMFGNAGCRYRTMSQMPLNGIETANVAAIKRAETAKGC